MKAIRNFTIALLGMAAILSASAQTELPGTVEVANPMTGATTHDDFLRASQKIIPANQGKDYWMVFSDRSDNKTYTSPSTSSSQFATLDFNEKLYIAKIKDGFALVFTDENNSYPKIYRKAVSRGWVPMSNLLLWQVCPTDQYGVYDKALTVLNLDVLDADIAKDKLSEKNMLRSNPDKPADRSVSSQQIFFVMKEIKCKDGSTRLLLSATNILQGINSNLLMGWVDAAACSRWLQRSCLEQTTDKRVISRSLAGETLNAYATPNTSGERVWNWRFEEGDKRISGEILRFPVLTNDSNDPEWYKCTIFGGLGDAKSTIEKRRKAIEETSNKSKAISNINIIIVIDGTKSMAPYYSPVKKAIQNAVENDLKDFNVKVGLVIYRDQLDGEYATEFQPMTRPDDRNFWNFFDEGGRYHVRSSDFDHTAEEDMLTGLELALDNKKMGYSTDESNVLLLIGDCGNVPDDAAARIPSIIDKMVNNNIQLLAFQTNVSTEGAYGYFRSQVNNMLLNNITRQYKKIHNDLASGRMVDLKGTGRQYQHTDKDNADFLIAAIRYPKNTGAADPAMVGQLVSDNIGKYGTVVQKDYKAIQDFIVQSETTDNRGKFDIAYAMAKIGKNNAEVIKDLNATMASTAYVPIHNSNGANYWDPVIFISKSELATLMGKLAGAYNESTKKVPDRSKYVEALMAVVKSMIPEANAGDVNGVTLNDITRMIGGLNIKSEGTNLKDRSLVDLQNELIVKDDEFAAILSTFRRKYESLQKIQSEYNCVREFGGETYYWIPIKDLP